MVCGPASNIRIFSDGSAAASRPAITPPAVPPAPAWMSSARPVKLHTRLTSGNNDIKVRHVRLSKGSTVDGLWRRFTEAFEGKGHQIDGTRALVVIPYLAAFASQWRAPHRSDFTRREDRGQGSVNSQLPLHVSVTERKEMTVRVPSRRCRKKAIADTATLGSTIVESESCGRQWVMRTPDR